MRLISGLVLVWVLVEMAALTQGKTGMRAMNKKTKKSKGNWRMSRCRRMMTPLQEELSELQKNVEYLSNPIHVHVHGAVADAVTTSMAGSMAEKHGHGEKKPVAGHESGNMGHMEKEKAGAKSSEKKSGEEQDGGSVRQSHVHIHLNMAAPQQTQGEGQHACHADDHGYPRDDYIYAKCDMMRNTGIRSPHNVRGAVFMRQKPKGPVEVKLNVYGFNTRPSRDQPSGASAETRHLHGFHVHEFGDFQNGCNSFGGHYNPGGHGHGGPSSGEQHVGDWGNIEADKRGVAIASFNQTAFLYGPESIVGRGIVVHEHADDLGEGGTHSSRTTGSAGSRLACCIIARYKGDNW